MSNYTYYKTENGYTTFPALIEDSIDCGKAVSFEKILNANFGSYSKCTISVPTDLLPEVCENMYGEKMLVLNTLRKGMVLSAQFSRFPLIRLPIKNGYAYFDLERHDENDVKVGKTIRVKCKIEEDATE